MKAIEQVEKGYFKKDITDFRVGDIVKLSLKVVEGDKTRTQSFEGIVIRRRGKGTGETFSVLKQSKGSPDTVEKTFPIHSPMITKITVVKSTKTRRSKLYYLRNSKSA
ncbi:MAG: 50S ribosomal protein L19 [Candidatus Omnitrophica bacterium]|nr:50S ribosomal protein L19 [Candidatus Omnitrophota bacterium]